MNKLIDWKIPLKTISESNSSEHWAVKLKRHKRQKKAILWFWKIHKPIIIPPCHIKLSRIAPRTLDFDNLVSSFKWIKDSIADRIHPGLAPGRADDDQQIAWSYHQEKGEPKEYAIKIEIFS